MTKENKPQITKKEFDEKFNSAMKAALSGIAYHKKLGLAGVVFNFLKLELGKKYDIK